MGRDHRGTDILVTEEFLDGPDVVAVLQQMGPILLPRAAGVTPWTSSRGQSAISTLGERAHPSGPSTRLPRQRNCEIAL